MARKRAAEHARRPARGSRPARSCRQEGGATSGCEGSFDTVAQRPQQLGEARLAILALVGEIDPEGTRRVGLDAFLDQKVDEGYEIETRTETHAVIFRRPKGLRRFTSGADAGRYVVEVDEDGVATMRPAEPRRT
jgi:hypothetical protein